MTKEMKIGMMLILVLVCAFAFVVYRKIENRDELLAETVTEKTDHGPGSAKADSSHDRGVKPQNNESRRDHDTVANQQQKQEEPPLTQEPRLLNSGTSPQRGTMDLENDRNENSPTGDSQVQSSRGKNPFASDSQSKPPAGEQQQPVRGESNDQAQQTFKSQSPTEAGQSQTQSQPGGFGTGEKGNPFGNTAADSSKGVAADSADTAKFEQTQNQNQNPNQDFAGKTISVGGTTAVKEKEASAQFPGDNNRTAENPAAEFSPGNDGPARSGVSKQQQPAPVRQPFAADQEQQRKDGLEQKQPENGQSENSQRKFGQSEFGQSELNQTGTSQTQNSGKPDDFRYGDFTPGKKSTGQAKSETVVLPNGGTSNPQEGTPRQFGLPSQSGNNSGRTPSSGDSTADRGKNAKTPFALGRQPGPRSPGTAAARNSSQGDRPDYHTVRPGENYWTISRTVYGTARYYMALSRYNRNRVPDPRKLRPGMKVLIPSVLVLRSKNRDLFPQVRAASLTKRPGGRRRSGFFRDRQGNPWYRVKVGDTLSDIAHKHLGRASRWIQLYQMNRKQLKSSKNLTIGTELRLPADASRIRLVRGSRQFR